MTNAEKIKNMTIEELAKVISDYADCYCSANDYCQNGAYCYLAWVTYLEKEADDDA